MSSSERHRPHEYWIESIIEDLDGHLLASLESYRSVSDSLGTLHKKRQLRCLSQAKVIGVTTTGLALILEVLGRLRSKVLMCEEAGEVLEAHTLTALLPSIEHAIFIGDHEQLRPQVKTFELRQDNPHRRQYSLDISLFERLVKPEHGISLPFTSLRVQRRMHPSIADLTRNTIYHHIEDHGSVSDYPEVIGMKKRLLRPRL